MSNILFVCSANRDRSRTAEIYFQNKYPEHRFRSAGINKYLSQRHGGIYLQSYMLDIADRVICAEKHHLEHILNHYDMKYEPKIDVMDLGDTDTFMTENLIKQLELKFKL